MLLHVVLDNFSFYLKEALNNSPRQRPRGEFCGFGRRIGWSLAWIAAFFERFSSFPVFRTHLGWIRWATTGEPASEPTQWAVGHVHCCSDNTAQSLFPTQPTAWLLHFRSKIDPGGSASSWPRIPVQKNSFASFSPLKISSVTFSQIDELFQPVRGNKSVFP